MVEFIRWRSIENSYREKFINGFLAQYPELLDEMYIITEKLHGANFQWFFAPGEKIRAGSRNRYLDTSSNFQGASISDLMKTRAELLNQFKIEVARWNAEFASYITENRLQSVFSKEGEIEKPKQIGQYIKWILFDAKEDFLKDWGEKIKLLDINQQKQIFNIGSKIANMLKNYL